MNDMTMVYVACDPQQPGAAWAIAVDLPKYSKDTAKSCAGWIRKGANIMHTDIDTGREMLRRWVRPPPKPKATRAESPAHGRAARPMP